MGPCLNCISKYKTKRKLQIVPVVIIVKSCDRNTSTGWTMHISYFISNFFSRPFLIFLASYVSFIDVESCREWSINYVIDFCIIISMHSNRYSEIFKFIISFIMTAPTPIHTAGSDTIFVQIYMDPPPGVPGVSNDAPGSTKHAI